jgi:hypothetical protein
MANGLRGLLVGRPKARSDLDWLELAALAELRRGEQAGELKSTANEAQYCDELQRVISPAKKRQGLREVRQGRPFAFRDMKECTKCKSTGRNEPIHK